jgi:hypothetical protein
MVIEPNPLILKQKHKFRVSENRMPRRVFQAMRGNATKE